MVPFARAMPAPRARAPFQRTQRAGAQRALLVSLGRLVAHKFATSPTATTTQLAHETQVIGSTLPFFDLQTTTRMCLCESTSRGHSLRPTLQQRGRKARYATLTHLLTNAELVPNDRRKKFSKIIFSH